MLARRGSADALATFLYSDIANGWYSTANTAVPAEFAGIGAVERFTGNVGRNRHQAQYRGRGGTSLYSSSRDGYM